MPTGNLNIPKMVALLAEGVDRNSCVRSSSERLAQSPSSRRAWIEITREPF